MPFTKGQMSYSSLTEKRRPRNESLAQLTYDRERNSAISAVIEGNVIPQVLILLIVHKMGVE